MASCRCSLPDARIVANRRFNAIMIRLQIGNYFRRSLGFVYGARRFGGHVLVFMSDCAGSGLDNHMAACMDNRMAACMDNHMAACMDNHMGNYLAVYIRRIAITRHMQRIKNPSLGEGLEEGNGYLKTSGLSLAKDAKSPPYASIIICAR